MWNNYKNFPLQILTITWKLFEMQPYFPRASLTAQLAKESSCNAGDSGLIPGSGRDRLPTPVFLGFPGGSAGKESTCTVGNLGSIPGLGRSPLEGNGYPLQYSGLENSMDCTVHGVTKSWTLQRDFHFHFTSPTLDYSLSICLILITFFP